MSITIFLTILSVLTGVYSVSSGVSQFTVNVTGEGRRGLQLRGDILIKCYHRSDAGRETIFACQFHTCAVADHTLSFTRQELDVACNGKWRNFFLFPFSDMTSTQIYAPHRKIDTSILSNQHSRYL